MTAKMRPTTRNHYRESGNDQIRVGDSSHDGCSHVRKKNTSASPIAFTSRLATSRARLNGIVFFGAPMRSPQVHSEPSPSSRAAELPPTSNAHGSNAKDR